jgi:hypothetical protein
MGIEPISEGWEDLAGMSEKTNDRQHTIQSRRKFTRKLEADARLGCHENVTQIAGNGGKIAANNNGGRRKQVAGICPNLLISFD